MNVMIDDFGNCGRVGRIEKVVCSVVANQTLTYVGCNK